MYSNSGFIELYELLALVAELSSHTYESVLNAGTVHAVGVQGALGACVHDFCREVSVAARTVPVWEEFGGERDVHIVVFGDTA